MSVVIKNESEPVVRLYVDYQGCLDWRGWCVMYVTHEDADGYMEGGIYRRVNDDKHSLDKADDLVKYMNECIADGEQFVVEQYADGSSMMKLVR
jgi:hypothetical protein